jgi:hypothetical protein
VREGSAGDELTRTPHGEALGAAQAAGAALGFATHLAGEEARAKMHTQNEQIRKGKKEYGT